MEHFSLEELCDSETARRSGLTNIPPRSVVKDLMDLAKELLEPLCRAYGKPLHIVSGYRSEALNRVVGGSSRSRHLTGEAVDIGCDDPKALLAIFLSLGIAFDQAILYPSFLHISRSNSGQNRGCVLFEKEERKERP